MSGSNGIFEKMCKEAADELAKGDQGWREMETNTLLMACFHLLTNHLTHKLARPLWFAASAVGVWAVGTLLNLFMG